MDATYNLSWHKIKKGSLIKFDGDNIIYRILTLDTNGIAQIMPYDRDGSMFDNWDAGGIYDSQVSWNTIGYDSPFTNQGQKYNAGQTKLYYYMAKPLTETTEMQNNENVIFQTGLSGITACPFRNYLQLVGTTQDGYMSVVPVGGATKTIHFGSEYYYGTGLSCANSVSYHWRPLTMDDITDYLGTNFPNAANFEAFWPVGLTKGLIFGNAISSQAMTDDSRFGAGFYYRSGSSLSASSSTSGVSGRFIPVFKLSLVDCLLWQAVQE